MTAASVTTKHSKKLMKFGLSLFRRRFNSSKCKTAAKMTVARIKLLRNKREVVVKQMRRDIALLLQSGQDATARIRVEHVIREQNVLAANELIELFCELIVSRLSIIAKQRQCPADLREGIASLIFAAPRCSEIPELVSIRDVFEKKYGKDFVSAATDLRPSCGVNRMLIDKLSVRTPTGEVKLKVMKEIAKEYRIDWDTTESEKELLKPPEELIEGPPTFISATSLPVKHVPSKPTSRSTSGTERKAMHFEDTASAAEAAAESAKKAIAAAQAAAYLANKDANHYASGFHERSQESSISHRSGTFSSGSCTLNDSPTNSQNIENQFKNPGRIYESQSFDRPIHMNGAKAQRRHSYNTPAAHSDIKFEESDYDEEIEPDELSASIYQPPERPIHRHGEKVHRRHSYNAPATCSDIKFDESDSDEEIENPPGGVYQPPNRLPPSIPSACAKQDPVPRIHPKLPDYDELSARFEALKYRKSQT
ncbi:Ist1 domain-containing protein [Cephalotus follicularis]|uniref:Ist1 domain-containing protein n=1 Tax=Cephalotus follicularis TaxID=3775 RepID=A0A1Q3CER5_CEPFO|nr:Ist1 domain-containing protein [Cephalotus follicularis]